MVPIPTLPEEMIRLAAGVIVRSPEGLEMVEFVPAIYNLDVGLVVPIPIFPLFAIYKAEVKPASPPTLLWKLRDPLFRMLKVARGEAPVGTTKERLEEIVAVGLPELTLIKPNLALEVPVPPMRRS